VRWGALLLALALALALGGASAGRFAGRMPQVARGDGALAVAFGDAREVLSRAMVRKADSYFHGGIDMDCHAHGHGCGCAEGHEGHGASDPWAWINSHVRAPTVHRHLEGGESVEMLPWLWASVRSDPHNIDAWTTAAYVSGDMMKDPALALRILAEGKSRNPGNAKLSYYEGRALYARGKGDVGAAAAAFAEARDLALARAGGRAELLSEDDRCTYEFATNYLGVIERQGGIGAF